MTGCLYESNLLHGQIIRAWCMASHEKLVLTILLGE